MSVRNELLREKVLLKNQMQKGHTQQYVCVPSGEFRLTFDHAPASLKAQIEFPFTTHCEHACCCHMLPYRMLKTVNFLFLR